MSKVALIKGESRYKNVFSALKLVEEEIREKIRDKERIIIKPNFVSARVPLSATHVDSVRAVLDFLRPLTNQKIVIAEKSTIGKASEAFESFDYLSLEKYYDVELKDLESDEYVEAEIFDSKGRPLKVGIAKTILESDFRISVTPLKTHDTVVVTLSLKNMAVGALEKRVAMHQGYKAINLSLARLAEVIAPDLSVIDGFLAMEGDGPIYGEPVEMKVALAGVDFLSVDTVGAEVMGFEAPKIGYLYYCNKKGLGQGDLEKIEIVGNAKLEEVRRQFKPHPDFWEQLKWQ